MCLVCLVCFFSIIKQDSVRFKIYTHCDTHNYFFSAKRLTTVNFGYPIFAGLPSLHCPPTPLRPPDSACMQSTCPTSSPFRCSDHMTTSIIYCLDLRVNGFGRFCTLRHRCPPDGPPSLNVNLTLMSQEYICQK